MKLLTIATVGLLGISTAVSQTDVNPSTLQLSPTPGTREVVAALLPVARGESDPFVALPRVIELGDSVVPALSTVLSADSCFAASEFNHPTIDEVRKTRLFGIASLEAIGTQSAFDVLFGIASSSSELEHRGAALRAIGSSYHTNAYLDFNTPDKELIHLLILNLDDTTSVRSLQKSIGLMAREGLIAWMNLDPGDPQGQGGPTGQSREAWWQSIRSSLKWDEASRLFRTN
jgi:hypothetical protein